MKNKLFTLMILITGFSALAQNIIVNGDFSNGATSWTTYQADWTGVTANFAVTNGEAAITNIAGTQGVVWHVQYNQILTAGQIGNLTVGNNYTISFKARSTVNNRPLKIFFGEEGGGFAAVHEANFNLTTTMQTYTAQFTLGATYGAMKLGFEMGTSNNPVYIDDVSLVAGGSGGPNGPAQPAGFVASDMIGPNPVNAGEIFLACGPNNVGGNIIYRLFYAPSASIPADPTTATEYNFGSTAGDGDGIGAFGFVITGLDNGVNYTFWLYQYNTATMLYSTPAIASANAGGTAGGGDPMVTFRVDMSEYTGTYTSIELNGTFNGWCGNCAPMTNTSGDIWELTIPIPAGPIEYKFTFDNWTGQEQFIQGAPCTVTANGFTNRSHNVTADEVLPLVCWNSCSACGAGPATYNVVFRVDMSEYTGSFTTPEVNGTFNSWCGNCAPMTNTSGDVWELSIPLEEGNYEFKYSHDNWAGQETLTPGSSCTVTLDGFTNRTLSVTGDTTLDLVCFGSCVACATGSIEDAALNALSIYPNPTNGMVNIEGNLANIQGKMILFDINGKVVLSIDSIANVDLSSLDNGVYTLQIITENGSRVEKILLNK